MFKFFKTPSSIINCACVAVGTSAAAGVMYAISVSHKLRLLNEEQNRREKDLMITDGSLEVTKSPK